MADFNREDLLKVAKLSALELNENEIELFGNQLKQVLGFIDQIREVKVDQKVEQVRNENIFRDDVAVPTNPSEIIKLAPKHQESYFIVPKILNESKGV